MVPLKQEQEIHTALDTECASHINIKRTFRLILLSFVLNGLTSHPLWMVILELQNDG
jgi:hypothetical protein